jgi:hypothetical protein
MFFPRRHIFAATVLNLQHRCRPPDVEAPNLFLRRFCLRGPKGTRAVIDAFYKKSCAMHSIPANCRTLNQRNCKRAPSVSSSLSSRHEIPTMSSPSCAISWPVAMEFNYSDFSPTAAWLLVTRSHCELRTTQRGMTTPLTSSVPPLLSRARTGVRRRTEAALSRTLQTCIKSSPCIQSGALRSG